MTISDDESDTNKLNFVLKDAISDGISSATFYLNGKAGTDAGTKDYKVYVNKNALTTASADESAINLEVGTIKVNLTPILALGGGAKNEVVSFIEKKESNGSVSLKLTLTGAKFIKDSGDNPNLDVTSWFSGLSAKKISATRESLATDSNSVVITFKSNASAVASTSALKISPKIPASATTYNKDITIDEKVVFFITKDPAAQNETDRPKATLSNGTIGGKIGEPINEVTFTINIIGDCCYYDFIKSDYSEELLSRELCSWVFVDNGSTKTWLKDLLSPTVFIKASLVNDIKKGDTSFKVKFEPALSADDEINIPEGKAISGSLYVELPGYRRKNLPGLLCNVYDYSDRDPEDPNVLPLTTNANAKMEITE